METLNKNTQNENKPNVMALFFKMLGDKIVDLFEPEEVEVTFKEEGGKTVGYTYTKVQHKQVA